MTARSIALTALLLAVSSRAAAQAPLPLIPYPRSVVRNTGDVELAPRLRLEATNPGDLRALGAYTSDLLELEVGWRPELVSGPSRPAGLTLRLIAPDSALGNEGYRLSSQTSGVVIEAPTEAGLFHGLQTFRQLLHAGTTGTVPRVEITRRTPLPIPRHAPRRGPALLPGGVRRALHRPPLPLQVQHLPLAPDRRPGLADRDQPLPEADRHRLLPPRDRGRPELRPLHRRQHPVLRLLHPGRDPARGGLRRGPTHHDRPGNRDAGPRAGGHRRLPGTGLHARPLRGEHGVGRGRRHPLPQRGHLRLPRGGADRGDGALPRTVHPHRRRRGPQDPLEVERPGPAGHPAGAAG